MSRGLPKHLYMRQGIWEVNLITLIFPAGLFLEREKAVPIPAGIIMVHGCTVHAIFGGSMLMVENNLGASAICQTKS